MVVVQLQNFDNLLQEVRVRLGQGPNQTLSTSQKRLFVTLRVDDLPNMLVNQWYAVLSLNTPNTSHDIHTCLSMPARFGIWTQTFLSKTV